MMDERLIAEVQKHAIIYNRQKSNMINGDKCITKEIAWQDIARNLASDVDSCKKRWKYLRERYVQQKKTGDSPSYEHLSRPYLEKMKFLDNFIQPRKSYRNVGMFPVGASALQHMFDGNDSSRSSGSAKLTANVTVTTTNGNGKNDVDGVLSQFYHMNQFGHGNLVVKREEDCTNGHVPTMGDGQTNMPSSSSSIVSQESMAAIHGNCSLDDSIQMRKRRRTINNGNGEDVQSTNGLTNTNRLLAKDRLKSDDEGDDELEAEDEDDRHINDNNASARQSTPIPPEFLYSFYQQQHRQLHMQQQKLQQQQQTPPPPSPNMPRLRSKPPSTEQLDTSASTFSNPGDFLHSLYQQTAMARQTRSSEQLLGELVTSELLKMSKERKRIVQKKILEILFFDDD